MIIKAIFTSITISFRKMYTKVNLVFQVVCLSKTRVCERVAFVFSRISSRNYFILNFLIIPNVVFLISFFISYFMRQRFFQLNSCISSLPFILSFGGGVEKRRSEEVINILLFEILFVLDFFLIIKFTSFNYAFRQLPFSLLCLIVEVIMLLFLLRKILLPREN